MATKCYIYLQVILGKLDIHIRKKPVFQDNFGCARVIYISFIKGQFRIKINRNIESIIWY